MTRLFLFAVSLFLLPAPGQGSGPVVWHLPSDQCMAVDKNDEPVSSLVDENGKDYTLRVDGKGNLATGGIKRDPSAAAECAYVVCGGPDDPNHISACKTGRREPPKAHFTPLPDFVRMLTPATKERLLEDGPSAVIGIRG